MSFPIFMPHAADFYKTGHAAQYPMGMTTLYSNLTPRSDKHFKGLPNFDHRVVWFGLSAVCQWMLIGNWNDTFFNQSKEKVVRKYKRRMDNALGKNVVSGEQIAALHDLGYLPVRIKALREGSRVNMKVPLFTIKNTHPDFAWVTNYLETQISSETWQTVVNATMAYEFRRLLDHYADLTGASKDFVEWQGHDFSERGMPGTHAAIMSGAAHLLSFHGTDTIAAIDYLEDYYHADSDMEIVGGSVGASEHSCSSSNILAFPKDAIERLNNEKFDGKADGLFIGEYAWLKRMITEVYPKGVASYVSDTYDFWTVVTVITKLLKDVIVGRDGKLVLRPDSGDPYKIIVGDKDAPVGSPEYKGAVECLWEIFGGTVNEKGYKTLDSHIGLIYGDSIGLVNAQQILQGLMDKGFASDNIVFGIGSWTFQGQTTRDTFGLAMKATYCEVNGVAIELYKSPKTDDGLKKSAKGLLRVEYENNNFVLYENQTHEQEEMGELTTIFENSKMVREEIFGDIRARLHG